MKKLAIIFAVIALSFNVALADNVKPAAKNTATIAHNGFNRLVVEVMKQEKQSATVLIYDVDFSLLHTTRMKKKEVVRYDVSQLKAGHYIVKVEVDGEIVSTETFEKTK